MPFSFNFDCCRYQLRPDLNLPFCFKVATLVEEKKNNDNNNST